MADTSSLPSMADTDATAAAHILKLFVDTRARRVLFAEASRDAVGFLHSLLVSHLYSLPLDDGTHKRAIIFC